jgi:hypothetical protein
MSKLTLNDIVSGYGTASLYNANNTLIEAALENTLSRDGTTPNTMGAALDMNSNKINNLEDGTLSTDAATVGQLNNITLVTGTTIPSQATNANKVLHTDGTVTGWIQPQLVVGSNTPAGNIAATTIQTAINELDTDKVGLAGTETITGAKTFSSLINLSSGQLQFPATQNASADANTLDDYEEGTWTPSIGGTATYTTQTGTYTKIGNVVHYKGALTINVIGTGSTTNISGLSSIAPASGAGNNYVGVAFWSGVATSVYSLFGRVVGSGDSTIQLFSTAAAVAAITQNAIFQNGATVNFSGTYLT